MVQVPKALAPDPYKSPIAKPLSAEQKDAIQPTGPVQTRYPPMPIPDVAPLRIGTIDQPQDFVTMRERRETILGQSAMQSPANVPVSGGLGPELEMKLARVLNSECVENGSDTPDFILAQYLMGCLRAFNGAVNTRDRWYGRGVAAEPTVQSDPNMNQAAFPMPEGGYSDAELPATPVGRDHLA